MSIFARFFYLEVLYEFCTCSLAYAFYIKNSIKFMLFEKKFIFF